MEPAKADGFVYNRHTLFCASTVVLLQVIEPVAFDLMLKIGADRTESVTLARGQHACMNACVHACSMYVCVHACVRACVPTCVHALTHGSMHACMHACRMHACMRACVHACSMHTGCTCAVYENKFSQASYSTWPCTTRAYSIGLMSRCVASSVSQLSPTCGP